MIVKKRDKDNPSVTRYVGNMADLLQIIHDTKKVMVERHGPEEGVKVFEQMKAAEVLDHYAIEASEEIH